MAATYKVDGYDFWPFTRVSPGDGLDPADADFLNATFSEAGSIEGQPLISLTATNREFILPVLLDPRKDADVPDTKDGLHQLIVNVNRRLDAAATLEYREDGASSSTFHTVLFARFEPAYDFRRAGTLRMAGIVRLTCKPYGTTGTARAMATVAATLGVGGYMPMPSVIGDRPADLEVGVRCGSSAPTTVMRQGRITFAAAIPSGYRYDFDGPAITLGAAASADTDFAGATVLTTPLPGALAPPRVIGEVGLSPTVYVGRHRIFAVVAGAGNAFRAYDDQGHPYGPAQTASVFYGRGYGTIDLGVVSVPTVPARATVPIRVAVSQGSAYFSEQQDPARLRNLIILPEDSLALTVDTDRVGFGNDTGALIPWATGVEPLQSANGYPFTRWTTGVRSVGGMATMLRLEGTDVGLLGATQHAAVRMRTPLVSDLSGEVRVNIGNASCAVAIGKTNQTSPGVTSEASGLFDSSQYLAWSTTWALLTRINASQHALSIRTEAISHVNPLGSAVDNGQVLASRTINTVSQDHYLRFQQQGQLIAVEVWRRTGNASAQIVVGTLAATSFYVDRGGQPVIGVAGSGYFGKSIYAHRFWSNPSRGFASTDMVNYRSEDGTVKVGPAAAGGSSVARDLEAKTAGAIPRFDPNRHDLVIGGQLPLSDDSLALAPRLEVRVTERFVYAR